MYQNSDFQDGRWRFAPHLACIEQGANVSLALSRCQASQALETQTFFFGV
jgi:hypothetical protein